MTALSAQTYRPLEIIAVDDGSTDGGAEILNAWHDPDGSRPESQGISFRVFIQQALGLSAGRNNALNVAMGDWVAITDIDCRPEPDWIERMEVESRSESDLQIVGITGRVSFQEGDSLSSKTRARIIDRKYKEKQRFTSLANGPCSMFDRRALLGIGGFDPSWYHAEDMEVSCRLTEAGGYILHTPDAVVHHVAELVTKDFLAKRRRDARAHVRIIRNFGWKGPRRPDGKFVPFDFTSDARMVAFLIIPLLAIPLGISVISIDYYFDGSLGLMGIISTISLAGITLLLTNGKFRFYMRWSLSLWRGFLEGWTDALFSKNGHHKILTKREN